MKNSRLVIDGRATPPPAASTFATRYGPLLRIVSLLSLAGVTFYLYLAAIPAIIKVDQGAQLPFPPRDLDDIKSILSVFLVNSERRWFGILGLYAVGYLVKQAFAIPGSGLMNILGGAMYGQFGATVLVSVLSAVGSTLCFGLSVVFGRDLIQLLFRSRLESFRDQIQSQSSLYSFMLSLRLFPFFPQWFINIASPHLGVPIPVFFVTTLVGLSPYNFVTCGAGEILHEINSMQDILQWSTLLRLVAMAGTIFGLSLLRNRMSPSSNITKKAR